MKYSGYILAVCMCLVTAGLSAQNKVLHYHDWEIFVRSGLTSFSGEVTDGGISNYDDSRFFFSGGLTRAFGPSFQVSTEFMTGKTGGSFFDASLPAAFTNNIYFEADIFSMSLIPKANLSRLALGSRYRFRVPDVYVGAGVGLLGYRTIRRSADSDAWQASVGYYLEGSRKGPMAPSLVIPIGAELKLKATKGIHVGISYYYFAAVSDKLDTFVVDNTDSFSQFGGDVFFQISEKKIRSDGSFPGRKKPKAGVKTSRKNRKLIHPYLQRKGN